MTTKVDPTELVGTNEITALFGTERTTIFTWIRRGIFPPPIAVVSGMRLWYRPAVEEWGRRTGRLR